jgi:hypothetical protein
MRTNAIAPMARAVANFFATEFGESNMLVELPAGLDLEVEPYALIQLAGHGLTPAAQAMYDIVAAEIARQRPDWQEQRRAPKASSENRLRITPAVEVV